MTIKLSKFIILSIFSILVSTSYANIREIKLAIFDNPAIDTTNSVLSKDLQEAYLQGIKTAIAVGKNKGINIVIKPFFYGNSLLNIIQQAPNVKDWNPDVVMGLNSSNAALMSRSYFPDQLVISISASDVELTKLPPNFYSLGTPDLYTTKKITKYISNAYPNRGLFLIVGAESKESVGFANLMTELYEKENPKQTVRQSRFLSDDVNTMNIASLIKDYHPGDIIFLLSIAGTYNTQINLMNKIATYLAPNKLIFFTPVDNWQNNESLLNENKTDNPYAAFRIDTLYVDKSSKDYKNFSNIFEKQFHAQPTANISYVTYRSVISIISALEKYPPPEKLSTQKAILWSYQKALKNNQNWFRFMPIVLFKIEKNKEIFFEKID